MTLTEFLLARIAEDAAAAQAVIDDMPRWDAASWEDAALEVGGDLPGPQFTARMSPTRVLARCQADRQLLELHGDNGSIPGRYELRCYACESDYPCDTLKIMALPFAGHADYHPGWRS